MDHTAMLQAESASRRRVPGPVAVAQAVRRGRLAWDEDPEARAAARRAIYAITGLEHDGLARAHLVEHAVREELIWRPWDGPRGAWTGEERLAGAIAHERGVIVSFVHSGPFPGVTAAFASRTDRVTVVTGNWMYETYEDAAEERRRARWLANLEALPVQRIRQAGAFAPLAGALRAGGVVLLAFDVPGHRMTRFLERDVWLADGTARLAAETGAVVLPAWRARERWRVRTVVGTPFEPTDDLEALHARLAALHTGWIRARPAALEDPTREGWWASGIAPPGASDPGRAPLDFPAAPT